MEAEERPRKLRKLSQDVAPIDNAPEPSSLNQRKQIDETAKDAGFQSGPDYDEEVGVSLVIDETPEQRLGMADGEEAAKPLSKNQLKKQRRKQEWEDGRDYRKLKRKQKTAEKRARKREARDEAAEKGLNQPARPRLQRPTLLPITFVLDCGFDDLMVDKERISLASQLTRAYSDNSRAPFQAHLAISSWGGLLKDRFDTVLSKHYENWKNVQFDIDDFVHATDMAKERMQGRKAGKLAGVFEKYSDSKIASQQPVSVHTNGAASKEPSEAQPEADTDPKPAISVVELPPGTEQPRETVEPNKPALTSPEPEVIYLTSDSPHTLDELKPYSTYIIGGLVDKNRHKGICYRTACDKGIKTAKLPIGDYMEMQSRFVLATNHVVEIMLRWLECGDWGEAFMKVIPKRKGGKLRGEGKEGSASIQGDDDGGGEGDDVDDSGYDAQDQVT